MPNNNGSRIIAISVASIAVGGRRGGRRCARTRDSAELAEVVVTANKLNATKVLDTPVSIQAISGDALQRYGASGIMDIAGDIPGLSIQDLGPGDKKYVIRGINSAGASTTGVYYGEAVISGSNADDGGGFEADIRLYDLDRVEVLRGPQGTLYGASSMSGTIRFIPKMPDSTRVEGYVTAGRFADTAHAPQENYKSTGRVNLPLVEGELALRVVGWKQYDAVTSIRLRVGQRRGRLAVRHADVQRRRRSRRAASRSALPAVREISRSMPTTPRRPRPRMVHRATRRRASRHSAGGPIRRSRAVTFATRT